MPLNERCFCYWLATKMPYWLTARDPRFSLLLRGENAVPIGRRGLGLELRDPPPIKSVDRREVTRRGEPAVVEEAQRRRPILPAIGRQQGGMLFDELIPLDLLERQCENTPGLGLAFDRNEIDLEQRRIIKARRCLFADNQIDAIDLAEALQPRR